jgi:hypothetical protein
MGYAQDIVRHLGGEWRGHYGLAPAPEHSKRDRSLKIWPHATDENDVAIHSFAGDDIIALKRDWRATGLLPGRPSAKSPAKIAHKPKHDADEVDDAKRRRGIASWLWSKSEPSGAIVKAYFRSRGIELTARPQAIRFLPATPPKHPFPAMLVPFGLPDEPSPGVYAMPVERIQAVHLTYLRCDGSGKAPVDPQRRIIGSPKGSPLALIPPNDGLGLLIGEGIETALSGYLLAGAGLGCWAAGSAPFLPALADAVPDYIEVVTIARERDKSGAGQRGADELGRRLEARGIETIMAEV